MIRKPVIYSKLNTLVVTVRKYAKLVWILLIPKENASFARLYLAIFVKGIWIKIRFPFNKTLTVKRRASIS